jgi:O-antigen/teichoic acid export membrane protein
MKKKFLTNLALMVLLNLLIKPFFIFGIDRTVQNTVGLEEYGFYFSIFNFAFLFYILLDAGLTNFNNRNIAFHAQLLNKHFSSMVVLKFILAAVYMAVAFLAAWIIGYDSGQMKMLAWVGFNLFLLAFILYLRSNINGMLLFRTDSFISILDKLLMILICSVLLWGNITSGKFRIEWFVWAQTVAYGLTAVVAFLIVIKKARFRRFNWNMPFFVVILKKSMPYAVLALLMVVYNRLDAVLLERLIRGTEGERQAGIYANAFRLLDAFNQMAWLVSILLLPIYARLIKEKGDISGMLRLPFSLLFTVALIVSIGSWFYRSEIMMWLYPIGPGETQAEFMAKLQESSSVFGILMFCFLGTTTMYVFSTLLTANGSLKQLNLTALAGIGINFLVNLILIPRIQAVGSAYASLATQLLTAGVHILLVWRYFSLKVNYRFIGSVIAFAAAMVLMGWFSLKLPYGWKMDFVVLMTAGLLLAFTLRLINVVEIWRMLKEKAL